MGDEKVQQYKEAIKERQVRNKERYVQGKDEKKRRTGIVNRQKCDT